METSNLLQRGGSLFFLLFPAEAIERRSDWVKSCNQQFASTDGWMEGWLRWLLFLSALPPLCCSTCNWKNKKNQALYCCCFPFARRPQSVLLVAAHCSVCGALEIILCVCLCVCVVCVWREQRWGATGRTEGFSNTKCPQKTSQHNEVGGRNIFSADCQKRDSN